MSRFLDVSPHPDYPHLGGFQLLKPPPDTCPECAVKHEPDQPHNKQSLYYQYHYFAQHDRWPTWADAMAHCHPDLQAKWKAALRDMGEKIGDEPEETPAG